MATAPYSVLCVDDEPDFLEALAEDVAAAGFRPLTATSVQQGLELIASHREHLVCIISDYQMPDVNGFDFCKAAEKAASSKDIPFIILSGAITKDMALKGIDLRIAAFLYKPVSPAQLATTLQEKTKEIISLIEEKAALERLFISESQDLIQEIEPLLLAIEEDPSNQELLNSVFRLVHTVKGASGVLERPEITAFLHSFEDLLTKIKNGLKASPAVVTALLAAFDLLKVTIAGLAAGEQKAPDFTSILGVLTAAGKSGASSGASSPAAAAASPQQAPKPEPEKAAGIMVPTLMLDEFMHLAGEITVIRNMVNKLVRSIERKAPGDSDITMLGELLEEMHKINSTMQNRLVDLKKIQVATVLSKLPRTVRDVARQLGKQISLELHGGEVRVDTTIAAALNNSLIHMVRNCVDHGIETPEQRQAAGKAADGHIRLNCREEKDQIIVTIDDNGRGIDPEKLRKKLLESDRIAPDKVHKMSRQDLLMQIFEPGFSTAAAVTDISGRGVGMDMVRNSITKIKGRIEIASEVGKGTRFTLSMPIPRSVVIISSLIIESNGRHFAVPQDQIIRLVRLSDPAQMQTLAVLPGGGVMLRFEDGLLPLLDLAPVLGLSQTHSLVALATGADTTSDLNVLVLRTEYGTFGLVVDAVHDTEDAVMKTLHPCVERTGVYRGATFMGDGSVGLILDIEGLAKAANLQSVAVEDDAASKASAPAAKSAASNAHDFLTFTLDSPGHFAVPLGDVYRFEEFPSTAVKPYGERLGVVYRDAIMPLLDLDPILNKHSSKKTPLSEQATIRVFISTVAERFFAFAVRDICEIVPVLGDIDRYFAGPNGTQGLITIGGKPTTIVDITQILVQHGEIEPPRKAMPVVEAPPRTPTTKVEARPAVQDISQHNSPKDSHEAPPPAFDPAAGWGIF